jgi:hypothetical protein
MDPNTYQAMTYKDTIKFARNHAPSGEELMKDVE